MVQLVAIVAQATAPTQLPPGTIHAVVYAMMATFLVTLLLGGAFVLVNFGLLSRRSNDQTGQRTPSYPGYFKGQMFPDEPYQEHSLPAEDDEVEPQVEGDGLKKAG